MSDRRKKVALDELWDVVDTPNGASILSQDHQYSKVYAINNDSATPDDLVNLLREVNPNTGLSIYSHLVDQKLYLHIVVKKRQCFRGKAPSFTKDQFANVMEHYMTSREAEIISIGRRNKNLLSYPIENEKLWCFLGLIYSAHIVDLEPFTNDKILRFSSTGEIELMTTGKDPYFDPFKFYIVTVLDAPYDPSFWKELFKFDRDFTCITSLDKIDESFAHSLIQRTRNIYHAIKGDMTLPNIAGCFRYATSFLYGADNYAELEHFLSHVRLLGCNVAVQCIKAEEALANILPPGRVYGESATTRPQLLFPFAKEARSKQIVLHSGNDRLPKEPPSPPIRFSSTRNQALNEKWPLISYDESSGTLMTDDHDFFRVYSMESFWDPHLCPVNYPAIDRAVNTLADKQAALTFYLIRTEIDPDEATNSLMYEQMIHLREQNLAFNTRAFAVLNYRLQERNLRTIYKSQEEIKKIIADRLDTVEQELRGPEEAFHMITADRLRHDRVLEFFNPLLNSHVDSLKHFLQDPFSTHYLSEYLFDTDLDVQGKYVIANGKVWGAIVILDYPLTVRSDLFKALLTAYPKQFTAVVKIKGLSSQEQETLLRRRQRIFYSARTSSIHGLPDPRADLQAQQMEEAQLQQYAKGERVFDTQIILIQHADTVAQLESNQNELISKCRVVGLSPLRPMLGAGKLIFSCLPPGQIYRSLNRRTTTKVVTHLLPIHLTVANQNLADSDTCLVDRTGTPDGFKIFDETKPNCHAVITGASGQGKTILGEWLLESHLSRYPGQTGVTIIDLGVVEGGSYRRMVTENGGEYFCLDYNTPVGFDIMARLRKNPSDKSELNFCAYMIQEMTADPQARANGHGATRITQTDAYDLLVRFTQNALDPEDITLDNFIHRFTLGPEFRECQGRLENFFFNERTIDLENRLVCFDFQSLSRDSYLVSLLAYFLMQNVWLSVKDESFKYKFLLVDELGLIIENPMIAGWLEQMIRAGRKAGLAVWLISQQLKDLARSPHAPALVDNCAEMLLMKQGYSELMENLNVSRDDWQDIAPNSEPRVFSEFLRSSNVNRLYVPPSYFTKRHTNYLDRYLLSHPERTGSDSKQKPERTEDINKESEVTV
jgi:type IV secretory pathway VirB4 component